MKTRFCEMELESGEMECKQSHPVEDILGKPNEEMDQIPKSSNSLEDVRREKDVLARMLVGQRQEKEELKTKVQELTERCDHQEAQLEWQDLEIFRMDRLLEVLHRQLLIFKKMTKDLSLAIMDLDEEKASLEDLLEWRNSECQDMSCLLLEQNEELVELEREAESWRLASRRWHQEKIHLIGYIVWQKQEIAERDGLIQHQQEQLQIISTKCNQQFSKLRELREEVLCHSKECQTLKDDLLKQSGTLCVVTKQNEELQMQVNLFEENTWRLQKLALEE
ncbi:filamin A-interacting protein 1-like [Palaemon carinicauda]|uniref:filamin A-interacting protein 1-like n=1 Tax=Palaemon carinicauda TaxID=392227 RepID=UPI0035B6160F